MARWKLAAPHYLKVPGTEWEYKEIDRITGKPKRKVFPVPLLLDPREPQDCNVVLPDGDRIIVVGYEGRCNDGDIVFEGDPTPDMVPMDKEAKEISASFAARWKHPIESLEGNFSERLLDDLQKQVADVRSKTAEAPAIEGMSDLLKGMTAMMEQNQQILNALLQTKAPAVARRA